MTARTHLTVRKLPADVGRAIERERKRRGASLNATVIDLLRVATGTGARAPVENGLRSHAGGWTAKELRDFERSTRVFDAIDADLWR